MHNTGYMFQLRPSRPTILTQTLAAQPLATQPTTTTTVTTSG